MKEKLLALLVAKFLGIDSAILDRIATKQAASITDEGQLQTVADGITFSTILQGEADRRATEASQTAVSNYEKKHGLKDGKPQNIPPVPAPPNPPVPDDTPAWAKALIQQNQEITKRLETVEINKSIEQITVKAKDMLKKDGFTTTIPDGYISGDPNRFDDDYARLKAFKETDKQEQINEGRWTDKPAPGNPSNTEKSVDDYVKIMEGQQATKVGVVDLGVSK